MAATLDLKRLMQHKKDGYYPSFIHRDLELEPKTSKDLKVTVPTNEIYIVSRMVNDVEDGVFMHEYTRDGREIIKRTKITGDKMDLVFTEPFIVVNEIRGKIENTDEYNVRPFRMTLYILVCDATRFEKEIW